jgi:8-oxo-dGTP pyrophosphatase MutT (NUDIX family)
MKRTPSSIAPMQPDEAEDLFVRFFLNCPTDQLSTIQDFSVILLDAIYFHLAVNRRDHGRTIVRDTLFVVLAGQFFRLIPPLHPYISLIERISKVNGNLQKRAAAYGCICLNTAMTHVIVVHHLIAPTQYSFPKGKAREGESPMEAAARETLEETGIDVSEHLVEDGALQYKRRAGKSDVIMYFAINVNMKEHLNSPSPLEIAKVRWAPIESLGSEVGGLQADGPTKALLPGIQGFIGRKV